MTLPFGISISGLLRAGRLEVNGGVSLPAARSNPPAGALLDLLLVFVRVTLAATWGVASHLTGHASVHFYSTYFAWALAGGFDLHACRTRVGILRASHFCWGDRLVFVEFLGLWLMAKVRVGRFAAGTFADTACGTCFSCSAPKSEDAR